MMDGRQGPETRLYDCHRPVGRSVPAAAGGAGAAVSDQHVAALGVTRLLMGIPFWALAIWVSYLIIATPMHRHKVAARKIQTEVAVDAELEPSATGKDDDAS